MGQSNNTRKDAWAQAIHDLELAYGSEGDLLPVGAKDAGWPSPAQWRPKCECGSGAVKWQEGHHMWWCPAYVGSLHD